MKASELDRAVKLAAEACAGFIDRSDDQRAREGLCEALTPLVSQAFAAGGDELRPYQRGLVRRVLVFAQVVFDGICTGSESPGAARLFIGSAVAELHRVLRQLHESDLTGPNADRDNA